MVKLHFIINNLLMYLMKLDMYFFYIFTSD